MLKLVQVNLALQDRDFFGVQGSLARIASDSCKRVGWGDSHS